MTVQLCHSGNVPTDVYYDFWFSTTDTIVKLPNAGKWRDVATRLERSYDECAEICWEIGLTLGRLSGAEIARTPTMGAYGTDFRLSVAWVHLAEELVSSSSRFLIVCDDPWLFAEISALDGILKTAPPSIRIAKLHKRFRGTCARLRNGIRIAIASLRLRKWRNSFPKDRVALMVYGHPGSRQDGHDAYFGDLMSVETGAVRILHTDCALEQAEKLSGPRTASLHAWGSPFRALSLVATKWRAKPPDEMPYPRLVTRAIEIENSGAGPMMTRWQSHCQQRWLESARPKKVVWPWENFAWERELCRAMHRLKIPAIGYQHTVVGRHQINFATRLNPDGKASLPDKIICNGPAYRRELKDWGHASETLESGGAFRVPRPPQIPCLESAPVYFALSASTPIALEQIIAARMVADTGRHVLVREHPMYPVAFRESENLHRAKRGLLDQTSLSAVVYSTGTTGLEALLAGLPTVRFQPDDRVAVQVLPEGLNVVDATRATIIETLYRVKLPEPVNWDDLFAPVNYPLWHDLMTYRSISLS